MSVKTWVPESGGMYTMQPSRGARAGETCYWARVWIKSQQKFAHFYLGMTLKQAQRKMREVLGNPEAALAQRNMRAAPSAPAFEALVKVLALT